MRVKGRNPFFRETTASRSVRGHSEEDVADLTARAREQIYPGGEAAKSLWETSTPAPGEGPKTG